MHVLLVLRDVDTRHRDLGVGVQVVKLGRDRVRVVRVGHRNGQAKRLLRGVAHMVVQVLVGAKDHLFVEVELVRAHAGPCLQHRRHVVEPARAHIGFVPVDSPAVVGRVDVTRQAFLIPMQLVRPAKMHLARQGGPVAEPAQVVRIGRHVGGKVRRVVVGADL